jgi:hypothetical protein
MSVQKGCFGHTNNRLERLQFIPNIGDGAMELGQQHLVDGLPNPDPLLAKWRVLLCEKKITLDCSTPMQSSCRRLSPATDQSRKYLANHMIDC